jgi:hypothetical protein
MSATANPHFEVQHQVLKSLRYIHRVCFVMEFAQAGFSFVLLSTRWLAPKFPAIPGLLAGLASTYFFIAIFAHIVVMEVLQSIGKQVNEVHSGNPGSVDGWILLTTTKQRRKLLPFVIAHGATLLVMLLLNATIDPTKPLTGSRFTAVVAATIMGLVCLARVAHLLRANTTALTSFVKEHVMASSEPL